MSFNNTVESTIESWKQQLTNHLHTTYPDSEFRIYNYSEYYETEPTKNPSLFLLCVEGDLWHGINYGDSRLSGSFEQFIKEKEYYYDIKEECLLSFYLRDYQKAEQYYNYFFEKWLKQNSENSRSYMEKISKLKKDALKSIKSLNNTHETPIQKKIIVETSGFNTLYNEFYMVLSETEKLAAITGVDKYVQSDYHSQSGLNGVLLQSDFSADNIEIVPVNRIDNSVFYLHNEKSLTEWDRKPLKFNYMD